MLPSVSPNSKGQLKPYLVSQGNPLHADHHCLGLGLCRSVHGVARQRDHIKPQPMVNPQGVELVVGRDEEDPCDVTRPCLPWFHNPLLSYDTIGCPSAFAFHGYQTFFSQCS